MLKLTVATLGLLSLMTFINLSDKANMTKQPFGKTADGQAVDLYTLTNANGVVATITNYGGTMVSMKVPDRNGKLADVILGYDNLDGYVSDKPYFGATVGRYANRIAGGQFMLDGMTYHLPQNNGTNCLHGGIHGFNKKVWTAKEISSKNAPALELTYLSKDGEEGFPGNLKVTEVFTLTEQNELKIEYTATTDKDTVLNLTNHPYFNLAGEGQGSILGTEMMLNGDKFLPVDSNSIPTGEYRSVKGTPFDFTTPMTIGARINQSDEQLKLPGGYDHSWVLPSQTGDKPQLAARAHDPISGRVLEVYTTEPAIQFYTSNSLGATPGKGGKTYNYREAFCLEAQHFPDSPNHPKFPTTELKPGMTFHSVTIYKFSAQ
jgi:aldose 1-epimerase